jgi:hypothetical protein
LKKFDGLFNQRKLCDLTVVKKIHAVSLNHPQIKLSTVQFGIASQSKQIEILGKVLQQRQ